jgi:hypothetical protein
MPESGGMESAHGGGMTCSAVSAYDDGRADDERVAQDLEDLARFRQVEAWERRVRQLRARIMASRQARLFHRRRLIRHAMLLKPACTEAVAAQWVDGLIARGSRH